MCPDPELCHSAALLVGQLPRCCTRQEEPLARRYARHSQQCQHPHSPTGVQPRWLLQRSANSTGASPAMRMISCTATARPAANPVCAPWLNLLLLLRCRDYLFSDVYEVVAERVGSGKALPVKDTYQLIECIKTPEQVGGGRSGWPSIMRACGLHAAPCTQQLPAKQLLPQA